MPRARLALALALVFGGALGARVCGVIVDAVRAEMPTGLVRRLSPPDAKGPPEVEVDYGRGLLIAHVGAAADLRLPGPRASRPEAERRARRRGLDLLRATATKLALRPGVPVGPDAIDRAAQTPLTLRIEYLSNGGVLLDLGFDFATLTGAPPVDCQHEDKDSPAHERLHPELAPLALDLATAPLALQPRLIVRLAKDEKDGKGERGEGEVTPAFAVYRVGLPPAGALAAKADKQGRLVLGPGTAEAAALSGRRVVVYLRQAPTP